MAAAAAPRPPLRGPGSAIAAHDFDTVELGEEVRLHLRRTEGFATARVDVFLCRPLRRRRHTAVALISRLLERGTRQLPDLLHLNRFLDELYGASFAASTGQLGPWQVLHLYIDVIEPRYTPDGGNPLPAALAFLGDVLYQPARQGDGFPPASVAQEKAALAQFIAAYHSDRTAWAVRRCTEEMCRGRPCALAAYGDRRDLPLIGPRELLELHFDGLARHPMDIYISSGAASGNDGIAGLAQHHLVGRRHPGSRPAADAAPPLCPAVPRAIVECQDVQQGRLVLGFRTPVRLGHADFAPLVLANMVLGGDANSRLYRAIREERGLAYHVDSTLEPLAGLLHVEAGIEPGNLGEVRGRAVGELQGLAARGPRAAELARARRLALTRLASLTDDREGLTRFSYHRVLGQCDPTRRTLMAQLESTASVDVARAAASLCLDTAFFMAPGASAGGS